MKTYYIFLGLASLGAASKFNLLSKRQDSEAFIPGTTLVTACAANEVECNDYCLDLAQGDVCCSEGYGCPGGSFCLTQGYCCPDGLDPATCALNNGVTLGAGFNTQPVPPTPAATATNAATDTATETAPLVDSAPTTATRPTFLNSRTTVFTTTARPSQSFTPFDGEGARLNGAVGVMLGAAAGVLGLVL